MASCRYIPWYTRNELKPRMGLWPFWVFPQFQWSRSQPRRSLHVSTKVSTIVLHAPRARDSNIFNEPRRPPGCGNRFHRTFRIEPNSRRRLLPHRAVHCCKPPRACQGDNIDGEDGESRQARKGTHVWAKTELLRYQLL